MLSEEINGRAIGHCNQNCLSRNTLKKYICLPSFASRRTSEAPTYELKWNEGSQRFEATLSDSNGVLSDFDFGISGYSVDKNGNSITISSTSVNTTATTGTFTSNVVVATLKLVNVPTEPKLPQTGDNANPLLYLGIGALALITGVGVGLRGRKKKNKQ